MFTQIETSQFVILIVAGVSVITDLSKKKIYNFTTFPAILIGFVLSVSNLGANGLLHSGFGFLIGLLLYGWLFFLRVMGGGDVKLLMAFGALGGAKFAVEVGLLGIMVGGCLAAVVLMTQGKMLDFIQRLQSFFVSLMVKEMKPIFSGVDHKNKIPFGAALGIAAAWIIFSNPFEKLGLPLWN
jgi:prepilin peptidase CpaA